MMDQTLGSRIAELRRKKNMTQEELAAELGVTPQAVSKWENDLSCPDITLLPQLARLFDVEQIFKLVEQGVIGKLVEVESAKGDTVEVFVE